MSSTKEINLSTSVSLAIQYLKRALEMRYGFEVDFLGDMKICPHEIKEDNSGVVREVNVKSHFRLRHELDENPALTKEVTGYMNLRNYSPGSWTLQSSFINVWEKAHPSKGEALADDKKLKYSTTSVCGEMVRVIDDPSNPDYAGFRFWQGTCLADRVEKQR